MKKIILFVAQLAVGFSLFAQYSVTEMGARAVADLNGTPGISIDAVMPLSKQSRMHGDFGVIANGVAMNILYNYQYVIPELRELSVYPGLGMGMYVGDVFNAAIVGEFGAEYKWDFPVTIGFDIRPRIDLIDEIRPGASFGAVARYRF